jgi:small-conductance mechanosensitive channel
MSWIPRLATFCLAALLMCGGAMAQPDINVSNSAAAAAVVPAPTVAELREQFTKITATTADTDDDARKQLAQINDIGLQADKFVTARTGELADLNARLGELGNPPAAGATEDPDITRQRARLTKERNALDADVRLARLLSVDVRQRGTDLVSQRRALFEAQLTERAASPLTGEFWSDLREAWPDDLERLKTIAAALNDGLLTALEPISRTQVIAAFVAALLLAVFGNWAAEHLLTRLAARVLPAGRLRRSLLVIGIVGSHVLLVAVAAHGFVAVLKEYATWEPQARKALQSAAQALVFMAFVIGLGRGLLATRRPSWRLPPIPDAMATRLAALPWLVALVAALAWTPAEVNALIDASFAAVVATHVLTALVLTALVGSVLYLLKPLRADAPDAGLPERPVWVGLLVALIGALMIAIWVLMAVGYVALASFLASQITWSGIVAAAFYVLFKFADDVFMALVSSRSTFGQRLQKSFNLAPQTLDQTATVLSGLSRVGLFFYMLIALAAPLGTGPGEVFQRSGKFGTGVKVGEFQLVPGAILSAIAVAVVGFVVLRVFKRWLERSYLPNTQFEPGMQSSITTLLGYVGGILVVAFALSALGIGIERIAWVASALSVGIGFGLQAIVQNFISGLILLAEQPVKVGDWVVLGTAEGDVRRINVRATEIQMGDRSTVIVPNSEFITKVVRNVTLADPLGLVQLKLPVPLGTDAQHVRELLLQAFDADEDVLATPAPAVLLDGVDNGTLMFNATGYVNSPRIVARVRSALLFDMLSRLKEADITLARPPTMLINAPEPQPAQTPATAPTPEPAQPLAAAVPPPKA